ncbi:MAG: galactose-1-phosphate uridylyltransferase [Nocardiopsaceae bacterium]|nr:galactose-1-phosphate uridylyltransferase [Nocardiopsaceae bacterium]
MSAIAKRVTQLSDGRELIYFDDADTTLPPGRKVDERPPDPRPPVPELRLDPLTGEWISVATARQGRAFLPPADLDPLAPSAPGRPTEIPDDYDVAVFENRSPSFGPGLPPPGEDPSGEEPPGGDPSGEDEPDVRIALGRSRPGYGRCEVVCFTPEHTGAWGDLSPSRARTIVEAWADRTAELSRLPGVRQVYVFENRGPEIGVTLHHPHGQIYAYPYVTPRTRRLLASIGTYGPDLMADILAFEQNSGRVLIKGEHFTVFVPFAARWPVEVHMLAHRHVPDLAATTGAERDEIAYLYRRIAQAIDLLYDTPTPYIGAWHQAPVRAGRDTVRLMLQVTSPRRAADKLKYLAGSETGMGAFIGDISPEDSAERIKAALSALPD